MSADPAPRGARGAALRFELLGPVRAWRGGTELDLGFPQQRALLALLLAYEGRPVPAGELLGLLWPGHPPASAPNVVRRYLGALRRLLEPDLPPRAPGRRLLRHPGGHLLEVTPDEVDLLRFRELTRQGIRAAVTGRAETAALRFTDALGEWRGPVAMGIAAAAREHVRFTAVGRELLETARLAADAALLCGRTAQILPALRRATALDPLDEPLHARLILSLAACGLQAEALTAYEDVRRRLAAELGITPGTELAAAHTRVLRQDVGRLTSGPRVDVGQETPVVRVSRPGAAVDSRGESSGPGAAADSPGEGGAPGAAPAVPDGTPSTGHARLPPDIHGFTGRKAELEWLTAARDAVAGTAGTPAAVWIGGMAGVGKTALAVHWAHRAAGRFPDGHLYAALRGSDPARPAAEPEEALRAMLTALGVPATRMPAGAAALTGLYRTLLAGRRVLVVLDDAAGTEQLRPLLPAAPGCLALVTSRHALPGLIASGARPLRLEPPPADDARVMLARLIGADRASAEPGAADEILLRSGRLPLALAVVAERAAAHREIPLADTAAYLRETEGTLDAFTGGATADVRVAFLGSYRLLSPEAARLFRLLPRHGGPGLTPASAAALAGLPVRGARRLLGELAESHLITEHTPGHYTLHRLLGAFAAERARHT
ncbi:AfsR/SARP family transcriptional regulator [Streptomyces bobili]|uniref:Winged helix-turn-helix domain-containing protein n=1 Tax=Streptomyces bobili TaxID=67280 RepID=A0ABZ1R9Q8_9ACTN|nr:BTAD domain-containing putative transcriptional regulator [Streptomyces bobili]